MTIRILIADPDRFLLGEYRSHLSQLGYDVITAATGLECVAQLRESRPDVLVLEPLLPWGGGAGVLALMHEDPAITLVPVLLVTGATDGRVLYNLAPFPIDDFQRKPLSAKQLADRLRRLVPSRGVSAVEATARAP